MDHPLHTITYVADIDHVLVIMAHVRPPPLPNPAPRTAPSASGPPTANGAAETTEGESKYIPKMTCHVLDSSNVSPMELLAKALKSRFSVRLEKRPW